MRSTDRANVDQEEAAVRIAAAHLLRRFVNERDSSDYRRAVELIGGKEADALINLYRFGVDRGGEVRTERKRNSTYGKSKGVPPVRPDGRCCGYCTAALIPRPEESAANFKSRKFCDSICAWEKRRRSGQWRKVREALFSADKCEREAAR